MADRHLEAAAEAVYGDPKPEEPPQSVTLVPAAWERWIVAEAQAGRAVTAYLDSLLGELPEEAVEAARDWLSRYAICSVTHPHGAFEQRKDAQVRHTKEALNAALTALRDSLASGTGQQHED